LKRIGIDEISGSCGHSVLIQNSKSQNLTLKPKMPKKSDSK
jgi:hypothetical protein